MSKTSEKNQPKEAVTEKQESQAQNPSESVNKLEEVKQHLLATGLKDYGFWWQEMLKEQKVSEKEQKPFRRGRIWSQHIQIFDQVKKDAIQRIKNGCCN